MQTWLENFEIVLFVSDTNTLTSGIYESGISAINHIRSLDFGVEICKSIWLCCPTVNFVNLIFKIFWWIRDHNSLFQIRSQNKVRISRNLTSFDIYIRNVNYIFNGQFNATSYKIQITWFGSTRWNIYWPADKLER